MNNGDKLLQNWELFPKTGKYAKYNWTSLASYDYDRTLCSGDCDDYCRCTSIINFKIEKINLNDLFKSLSEGIDHELFVYCIDRLIEKSGFKDPNNWESHIVGGYYGDELDKAEPNSFTTESFEESLNKLAKAQNDFELIKVALETEYQYLLPKLLQNDFSVEIKDIETELISLDNNEYMRKIDSSDVKYIENYKLPRAVCFEQGNKYRVIDGYHRTTASLKNKDKNIKIIVLIEK